MFGNMFSAHAWELVWNFRAAFALGFWHTLLTSFFAIAMSLALGLVFGLMSSGTKTSLRAVARIYVEFIQNTPLLLQICFLYYALSFSGHGIGILASGIISIGLYHGAYMSEVFRAGIQSIPKGQFESAEAQGFGYAGMMRYIILPQTVKVVLPPMTNQIVNLIKNTSVLYIIGGTDLISNTYSFVTGVNTGGAYGPAYLVCGALFFVMCYPLSRAATIWETSLKKRDQMSAAKE